MVRGSESGFWEAHAMKRSAVILGCLLLVLRIAAADFPFGACGTLTANVPDGWKIERMDRGPGCTFAFKPANRANASMLLTLLCLPDLGAADPVQLKRKLVQYSARFAAGSVEKTAVLHDLTLSKGCGAYCTFTDASLVGKPPEPGNYKMQSSGLIQFDDALFATFTLFCDDVGAGEFAEMLAITNSLRAKLDTSRLRIPGRGWSLAITAPALGRIEEENRGRNYSFRANAERFNLSLFVEQPQGAWAHRECYEFYWAQAKRNPMIDQSSVKMTATPRFYRVEYDIKTALGNGAEVLRNVNYYFVFEGSWVDLHISMMDPSAADLRVIERFDAGLQYQKDGAAAAH
jgi:hypothetical protein